MGIMRKIVVGGVAGLVFVGLAGCSGSVTAADAYKVGCPTVDAVAGGSEVAGKAGVVGLKKLYDSKTLGDEAQQWLGDTITLLDSGDATTVSADARSRIADGCAANGYPLTNVK